MGHEVVVEPTSGVVRVRVPVRTSPGRDGPGPALTLVHRGTAPSEFGRGWSLEGVPRIGVDASRRSPRWDGNDPFHYAGQRLVLDAGATRTTAGFEVERYRARVERTFDRIERWIDPAGRDHWRVLDRAGVVSVFGRSARIVDPASPERTFEWLIERRWHPNGDAVDFRWDPEDGAGVDLAQPAERRRTAELQAQRYLRRVSWVNRAPLAIEDPSPNDWLRELVLDYGDCDDAGAVVRPWPTRADPFSVYVSGFEVRTWRRCRRLLTVHHHPDLGAPCVIGFTELEAHEDPAGTTVTGVRYVGRRVEVGLVRDEALPALKLTTTTATPSPVFEPAPSAVSLPPGAQWIDLEGEGVPGVLHEHPGGWFYQDNLGGGQFGPARPVTRVPHRLLASRGLRDLDGNGDPDLVQHGPAAGFYAWSRRRERWDDYTYFRGAAQVGPSLAPLWVDLDGDGLPDLVVESDDALTWFPSAGRDGFYAPVTVPHPRRGPDGAPGLGPRGRTLFAPMAGDGGLALVQVLPGSVVYWPHLGRGRFGAPVEMADSPTLTGPVDLERLRLVDLDGSGTADLLWIGAGEILVWRNRSGNGFGPEERWPGLPTITASARLDLVDFYGDGTTCLVWTDPAAAHPSVQVLRLSAGVPPGLVAVVDDGGGRRTELSYRSASVDYLRDKVSSNPWRARSPQLPVVVNRRVDTDTRTGTTWSVAYRYRDAQRDDRERRFVGFGSVDQQDVPDGGQVGALVRSFAIGDADDDPADFEAGFFPSGRLPRPVLEQVDALTPEELNEARRALTGSPWRQEVFSVDPNGVVGEVPLETTEVTYRVRPIRYDGDPEHLSCAVLVSERLDQVLEGDATDPRTTHALTLAWDAVGTPVLDVSAAYARGRASAPDVVARVVELALIDEPDRYEVVGHGERSIALAVNPEGDTFTWAELASAVPAALSAGYLLSWERPRYWRDDRTGPLLPGEVGRVTLVHHAERIALSVDEVVQTYGDRVDSALLRAGFAERAEGWWWSPGLVTFPAGPEGFLRLVREEGPDGTARELVWDPFYQVVVEERDALGNTTRVEPDWQALGASVTIDPNGNRVVNRFGPLGFVQASALEGHQVGGDGTAHPAGDGDLTGWQPVEIGVALADPDAALGPAGRVLLHEPGRLVELLREEWRHDGEGGERPTGRLRVTITEFDGLGRVERVRERGDDGQWRVSGQVVRDARGLVVAEYEPWFASDSEAIDASGVAVRFTYDAVGRRVAVDRPDGSRETAAFSSWQTVESDPNDAVIGSAWEARRQALPADDPDRIALDAARANARTPTITELDARGRPIRVRRTGPQGELVTTTTLDARGDPITLVDARGLVAFRWVRDRLGRVVREEGVDAGTSHTVWDWAGREVHRWDGRDVHRETTRDPLGRVVAVALDGAVVERFGYGEALPDGADRNALGRVVTAWDGAGVLETPRYDPLGRPLEIRRTLCAEVGADPDWSGQVQLDVDALVTTTTWDRSDRVLSQRTADGAVRELTYDGLGQVTRLTVDGNAVALDARYDAWGRRTSLALGNGVRTDWTFDPESRRLVHAITAAGDRRYLDLSYTYDATGNLVRVVDAVQDADSNGALIRGASASAAQTFTYDAWDRLVEATGRSHRALTSIDYTGLGGAIQRTRHLTLNDGSALERYTRTYTYDPAGNLTRIRHGGATSVWATEVSVSTRSNRSTEAVGLEGLPTGDPELQFDGSGRRSSLPHVRALEWSAAGRLSRAVVIDRSADGLPDDAERYLYGSDGQRVRRVLERWVAGAVVRTETVWLPGCERKRVTSGGRVELERWTSTLSDGVQSLGRRHRWTVDTLGSETDDPAVERWHYALGDHLGSIALELGPSGEILTYEEYFPYGGSSFVAGDDLRDVALKDHRYQGKSGGDVTGAYAFAYRVYLPWIGNWLEPDPAGPIDGPNLYRFARNNPVRFVDPSGLAAADFQDWARIEGYTAEEVQASYNFGPGLDQQRFVTSLDPTPVVRDGEPHWNATSWVDLTAEQVEQIRAWLVTRDENSLGAGLVDLLSQDPPSTEHVSPPGNGDPGSSGGVGAGATGTGEGSEGPGAGKGAPGFGGVDRGAPEPGRPGSPPQDPGAGIIPPPPGAPTGPDGVPYDPSRPILPGTPGPTPRPGAAPDGGWPVAGPGEGSE
ncbi:MAG: SpvB/TcaC N-terminal domain-containing protein, partial [Myxococcota bacterium]